MERFRAPAVETVRRDFLTLIDHPDHEVVYDGKPLLVMEGVFTPDPEVSLTSSLLARAATERLSGAAVLDMGCGTGALALYAADHGARRVVAADVDNKALHNTSLNIKRRQVRGVEMRRSNLFEHIPERFDVILANLPISDVFWSYDRSTLSVAQRFVCEYKEHLHPNGRAYLAWGSFGDVAGLRRFLRAEGVVYTEAHVERGEYTYFVFELSWR